MSTVHATVRGPLLITAVLPMMLSPKARMYLFVESVVKLCTASAHALYVALVTQKVK